MQAGDLGKIREGLRRANGARFRNEVSIIGHQVGLLGVRICTAICADKAVANI